MVSEKIVGEIVKEGNIIIFSCKWQQGFLPCQQQYTSTYCICWQQILYNAGTALRHTFILSFIISEQKYSYMSGLCIYMSIDKQIGSIRVNMRTSCKCGSCPYRMKCCPGVYKNKKKNNKKLNAPMHMHM